MAIRVYIADDEGPARRELRYLLERIEEVEFAGEARNGTLALRGIRETKPHVSFLDVHMPGLNGLELSQLLRELAEKPLVVFATAFAEYAVDAFEVDAIDYLIKPFTLERVRKSIRKAGTFLSEARRHRLPEEATQTTTPAIPRKEGTDRKRLLLYKGVHIIPVSPDRVMHARSLNGEIFVQTRDAVYKSKFTLNELEQKLSSFGFMRAHRSSLVNINHVAEVIPWFHGSYKLVMNDGGKTEILVSRYNAKELKEHYDL